MWHHFSYLYIGDRIETGLLSQDTEDNLQTIQILLLKKDSWLRGSSIYCLLGEKYKHKECCLARHMSNLLARNFKDSFKKLFKKPVLCKRKKQIA